MSLLLRIVLQLTLAFAVAAARAEPVAVRYPEGPAHGFLVLTDTADKAIAHGELIQWLEGGAVVSNLVFRFNDGSLYDETVRFSQDRVFRLLAYELEQRGPSFTATSKISFDRSGKYKARVRAAPDEEEKEASGTIEMPDDATNGMTSIYLKNSMPDRAMAAHLLAFTPDPVVLDVSLKPEGVAEYRVGSAVHKATRFLIDPQVPGVKGVLATVMGKQPPSFTMWIAQGKAPVLIRFQGPLYAEGPTWRIGLSAPRFER